MQLPNISLPSTASGNFELQSLRGKYVVLYFYPKDATPGCTTEGHDFNALLDEFTALNAEVFGVSRDNLASHQRFKERQAFRFDLLSDADEKLCQALEVIKEKNLYGRKYMGIDRSTFLFGTDGNLLQEWRNVKVKGHAQKVLEALREHQS